MTSCWIHISKIHAFLSLGVAPEEQAIGQNLKIKLSLKLPLVGTEDKLERTEDYGAAVASVLETIKRLKSVQLMEYLAEQILEDLGKRFPKLLKACITIQKAYVPLPHFTGQAKLKACRTFVRIKETV